MERPNETPEGQKSDFSFPELTDIPNESGSVNLDTLHEFLAGLDKWASEMRQRSGENSEQVEKIYYSRLPEALFHATTSEKAKKIKAEGLRPSQLQFEDNAVVSLSDSIKYAKFCAGQTQGVPPEELVILEVTTQGLDREEAKSFLHMDDPYTKGEKLHEVHYGKVINPDWIYTLTVQEVAEIESAEK